jgi:hypothetical protein
MKQRRMQLKAGANSRRGGNAPGPGRNYSIKTLHQQERSCGRREQPARGRSTGRLDWRPDALARGMSYHCMARLTASRRACNSHQGDFLDAGAAGATGVLIALSAALSAASSS